MQPPRPNQLAASIAISLHRTYQNEKSESLASTGWMTPTLCQSAKIATSSLTWLVRSCSLAAANLRRCSRHCSAVSNSMLQPQNKMSFRNRSKVTFQHRPLAVLPSAAPFVLGMSSEGKLGIPAAAVLIRAACSTNAMHTPHTASQVKHLLYAAAASQARASPPVPGAACRLSPCRHGSMLAGSNL